MLAVVTAVVAVIIVLLIVDMQRYRAYVYHYSCRSMCRHIDSAKEQFAMHAGLSDGALIAVEDISQYFPKHVWPGCPGGETLILHRVGEDPECEKHGVYGFNPMPHESRLGSFWNYIPFAAPGKKGNIISIKANH